MHLNPGAITGVGSLPHRDAPAAAAFSLAATPELPAVPSLPRRSPAENMIAQAVAGIEGVEHGQYGSLSVDARRVDPLSPVATDLDHDSYAGLRAFVEEAAGRVGPVKWQFVGPISLGVTLQRAGVPAAVAFPVAMKAVREHVLSIHHHLATELPDCPQIIVLDEPAFPDVMDEGFPLPPDAAIDLLSGALALIEQHGIAGVHCCGEADWAGVIASGPGMLSLPATPSLVASAGYLWRFMEHGGRIIWGVVPTDGPIFAHPQRCWKDLMDVWDALLAVGGDRDLLISQALFSPHCGLGLHSESVAADVFTALDGVSERARRLFAPSIGLAR